MRGRNLLWLTVLLPALGLVGCGSGGSDYTVLKEDGARVTLLVKDATKTTAMDAVRDYYDYNTGASDSPKFLDVEVVKAKGASTYVCRSRYFADKATATAKAGLDLPADQFPTYTKNCP